MKKLFFILILSLISPVLHAQDISIDKTGGFRIEKLEGKELIISFTTMVKNLTSKSIGVTIKKGQLYKDGEFYGTFKLLDKIRIRKNSNKNIDVKVKVMLNKEINLAAEGLKALQGKGLELQIKGKFKATWLIFWKNYPFEFKEKISLKGLIGK
ncbi:MAG: hypothetical protein K2X86_17920 [Cytophagaceae bacterium]|nr:hypothetical protein [Cytophagaceae bacterium]